MKFSEKTLEVLKNFTKINNGVILRPGSVQRTLSPSGSIMAEADLPESMDVMFGIYDLSQFLGNVLTMDEPELSFSSESVVLDDGATAMTYHACASPEILIKHPPVDAELKIDTPDVQFDISEKAMAKLLTLAGMNNLPNLSIIGEKGGIWLKVHEKTVDTSNFATTRVGDYDGTDFVASFATENLKMLPDDYVVKLNLGKFALFTNKAGNLKYFVAMMKK
jgi:hypothetical protein